MQLRPRRLNYSGSELRREPRGYFPESSQQTLVSSHYADVSGPAPSSSLLRCSPECAMVQAQVPKSQLLRALDDSSSALGDCSPAELRTDGLSCGPRSQSGSPARSNSDAAVSDHDQPNIKSSKVRKKVTPMNQSRNKKKAVPRVVPRTPSPPAKRIRIVDQLLGSAKAEGQVVSLISPPATTDFKMACPAPAPPKSTNQAKGKTYRNRPSAQKPTTANFEDRRYAAMQLLESLGSGRSKESPPDLKGTLPVATTSPQETSPPNEARPLASSELSSRRLEPLQLHDQRSIISSTVGPHYQAEKIADERFSSRADHVDDPPFKHHAVVNLPVLPLQTPNMPEVCQSRSTIKKQDENRLTLTTENRGRSLGINKESRRGAERVRSIEVKRRFREAFSEDSDGGDAAAPTNSDLGLGMSLWPQATQSLEETVSSTMRIITTGMLRHIQSREGAVKSICDEYNERGTQLLQKLKERQQSEADALIKKMRQQEEQTPSFWSAVAAQVKLIEQDIPAERPYASDLESMLAKSLKAQDMLRQWAQIE